MAKFECSPELAKTLVELRRKAKGDYQGQAFARKLLRQALEAKELGKREFVRLFNWTYTWL